MSSIKKMPTNGERRDWEEFKRRFAGYYKRLKAEFPDELPTDRIAKCYQSLEEFVKNYPTPEIREALFANLSGN